MVPSADPNQMEFGFAAHVVEGYGNVGDVIRHFDRRLNDMETSISQLKTLIIDMKSNMPKRRDKTKNEFKKIT